MHLGGGDNVGISCKCSGNDVLEEMKEWNKLCKLKRGMTSISFGCGVHTGRNNSQGCLLITTENSKTLRNICLDLFADISEKDELIKNMIRSNQKNKENKELQDELLKNQKQIIKNLKEKISRYKIKTFPGLENELMERCRHLENEVKNLNDKIKQLNEEDEKVRMRSDKAFENLFKGLGRGRVDDSVITIIDCYERKLNKLVRSATRDDANPPCESPTPNFKLLLKSYENKLDSCNKKIRQLQTTNGLLRDQIQSGSSRSIKSGDINKSSKNRSSSLNRGVSFTPASYESSSQNDKKYLTNFCKKCAEGLDVSNDVLCDEKVNVRWRSSSAELENFYTEVEKIVDHVRLRSCQHQERSARCDNRCILTTLSHWADQMKQLEHLQDSLKNLSQTLFPWQPTKLNGRTCSVAELAAMVEGMISAGTCKKKCKHDDLMAVEKDQLIGMIEHFQKLFDVPNALGVTTRMSQLYVKLNENYNVMTNIKKLLSLDRKSTSLEVIDKISKMTNFGSCTSR